MEKKQEDIKCKECHRFRIKVRGKSCSDKGINPEDSIKDCKNYEPLPSIVDDIKQDDFIVSINDTVVCLAKNLDKSLISELNTYLVFSIKLENKEINPVPKSFKTSDDWETLQHLMERCQAYKDRVLDIQFSFTTINVSLDKLWRQAEAYIINTYSSFLSTLKDANQRNTVISDILYNLAELYDDIKAIKNLCERVTVNLNSSSFCLRDIKDMALKVEEIRSGKLRQL